MLKKLTPLDQNLIPILGTWLCSAVQMLQNVDSDQGLHCLRRGIYMQNTVKIKIFTNNGHKRVSDYHKNSNKRAMMALGRSPEYQWN